MSEELIQSDGFKKFNTNISKDICPICGKAWEENGLGMVECENCIRWFHFYCVGIPDTTSQDVHFLCETCTFLNTKSTEYQMLKHKKSNKRILDKSPISTSNLISPKIKHHLSSNSTIKRSISIPHDSILYKEEETFSIPLEHSKTFKDLEINSKPILSPSPILENPFSSTYDYTLDHDKPFRNNLYYLRNYKNLTSAPLQTLPYCYLTRQQKCIYQQEREQTLKEPSAYNIPQGTLEFLKRVQDILENRVILDTTETPRISRKVSRASINVSRHPTTKSHFSNTLSTSSTPPLNTNPTLLRPNSGSPSIIPSGPKSSSPVLGTSSNSLTLDIPSRLPLNSSIKSESPSTTQNNSNSTEFTSNLQNSSMNTSIPLSTKSGSPPESVAPKSGSSSGFPNNSETQSNVSSYYSSMYSSMNQSSLYSSGSYPLMSMQNPSYNSYSMNPYLYNSKYNPTESSTHSENPNPTSTNTNSTSNTTLNESTSNSLHKSSVSNMMYSPYMYDYTQYNPYSTSPKTNSNSFYNSTMNELSSTTTHPTTSSPDPHSTSNSQDYELSKKESTSKPKSNSRFVDMNSYSSSHYYSQMFPYYNRENRGKGDYYKNYNPNVSTTPQKEKESYNPYSTRYDYKRDHHESFSTSTPSGTKSFSSSSVNSTHSFNSNTSENSKYYKSYDGTYKKSRFDDKT